MKILLVSHSILPKPGGSSVIVEQLAQNFSAEEMLVFGSRGIKQKTRPVRDQRGPEFRYFFSELDIAGRGARFFDWFRKMKLPALTKEISDIISKEQITHVLGVYPNEFYCLAACRAAKGQNVRFSSYFHNTYVENSAITKPEAQAWQEEIFEQSDHIFVMSRGMEDFYQKKYQLKKFSPLVHTFKTYPDAGSLSGIPGANKEQYKLVAIGNFNESNLEATRRFLRAIKGNKRYELSIYTHVPTLLMEKRGLDTSAFNHMGQVPPDDVHQVLQQYDICILTHGFTGGYGPVEYQTIFPTRTIPLLLSGKPIVAHSPANSFLNDFIKRHECAALVEQADDEAIVKALDQVADNANHQQSLVQKAAEAARQFYGPDVANYLKDQLTSSP